MVDVKEQISRYGAQARVAVFQSLICNGVNAEAIGEFSQFFQGCFAQTGVDAEGNVRGRFQFNGVRPKFLEKFKTVGIKVDSNMFDPSFRVEV